MKTIAIQAYKGKLRKEANRMAGKEETVKMKGYLTMNQIMNITGLCWPTVRKLAEEAGAVVRVGRRVLILSDKFDEHMHSLAEKGGA